MIALSWKNVNSPCIGKWLKELSACVSLENISYSIKGKQELFKKVWDPFLNYLEHVDPESSLPTCLYISFLSLPTCL